mgnify:CR=1 FL=1
MEKDTGSLVTEVRCKILAACGWQMAALLFLGAASVFVAYVLISEQLAETIVRHGTKPVFYPVYGLLFYCSGYGLRKKWRGFSKNRIVLLFVFSGAGTAIICAPHNFEYKVLNDEYVIPAQAKNLHFNGTSDYTVNSFPSYGQLQDLDRVVDKRPPAFSVLLALVHDFTGYRASNVFVLNAALCFALILILLQASTFQIDLGRGWLERAFWVLALVASLPLLGYAATGAGMDLYNGFLLFLSAFLAYRVLIEQDASRWVIPWLTVSFLLFNARYESVLFATSCGAILLVKAWQARRLPAYPALLMMPPLLMMYVLRHRLFGMDPERHWQLEDGVDMAFSQSYFSENLGHAIEYLFIPEIQGTASFPLAALGVLSILILTVGAVRRLRGNMPPAGWVLLAYGSVVLFNATLLLCYHWGRLDELEVSRLALPLYLLFGLCIVWVQQTVTKERARLARALLLLLILYVFCFALPSRSMEYGLKENYYANVDKWAHQQLDGSLSEDTFVVSNRPVYWNLHDIASMHQASVEKNIRGFEFHRRIGTVRPYILEHYKIDPENGRRLPLEKNRLEAIYETELIGELGYKAYEVAQLKKIIGLRPDQQAILALTDEELASLKRYPIDFWFYFLP